MAGIRVTEPGSGEALWFLDTRMAVKLGSAESGGALAVLEQVLPAGSATPMHRHDQTDEHFYVLEGEVTFHGEDGGRPCTAGSFVSVARGTPHAFRVSSPGGAKLLVFSAPAHFEAFVRAVSRPAEGSGLPPASPPPGPEAMRQLAEIGARNDTVLLGPPPA